MILWTRTAKRSEIHKKNITLALKGKEKSNQHRNNISKTQKEQKKWVGDTNPKADAIVIIFPDGKRLIFNTKT